jgi:hypothetical protein
MVPNAEDVPLSPNGANGQAHAAEPRPPEAPASSEPREPRLDFLFRARAAKPAPPPEGLEAFWPKRPSHQPRVEESPPRPPAPSVAEQVEVAEQRPAPVVPLPVAEDSPPAPEPAQPPAPEEARAVAVLKSGVVDGMAYTLYADGSIVAQLPQGTVRFGSISELRAHIETNS